MDFLVVILAVNYVLLASIKTNFTSGCGCSTVVKLTPRKQEVTGAGLFIVSFLSLKNVSFNRSLLDLQLIYRE